VQAKSELKLALMVLAGEAQSCHYHCIHPSTLDWHRQSPRRPRLHVVVFFQRGTHLNLPQLRATCLSSSLSLSNSPGEETAVRGNLPSTILSDAYDFTILKHTILFLLYWRRSLGQTRYPFQQSIHFVFRLRWQRVHQLRPQRLCVKNQ